MNILFVTIAWPKPGERNLYSDLMDEFHKRGDKVHVLCADDSISGNSAVEENGYKVLRVSTSRVRKVNKIKKALALFILGSKLERALFMFWPEFRPDLIIGHSPPVTFSSLFRSLKRKLKVPIYYLLKDIWPQGPADLKLIRKNGIVHHFFRKYETQTYKIVDFIGCMSPLNVEYILRNNSFLSGEKVEVCPNTIIPRELTQQEDIHKVRNRHNIPEQATVFIFSGNIGKAHGLGFYLDAIEKLKDFKEAYFLVGGSGQFFDFVVREISKRKLSNIGYYHRLPIQDFDQLLLASDVGVILLESLYTVPQFPSRLLAYLEARMPVLCSINKDTDIGKIVEESGCGISTLQGDIESFIAAVKYFCSNKNTSALSNMKSRSYELLQNNYTCANSYDIIMHHFKESE